MCASAQQVIPAEATGAPACAEPVDPDSINILLVNDDPGCLFALRVVLSDLNATVISASSGEQALMRLLRDDFAVILLDVKMSGMDGFDTARLIRQRPRSRSTPIIFLTSHRATDRDRDTGFSLGAVDYLFMPVAPEVLKTKVQVLIDAELSRRARSGGLARPSRPSAGARGADVDHLLAHAGAERLIVEHAADYVALLDADHCWLYASTSYQNHFGAMVYPGASYNEIVHPDDRDRVTQFLAGTEAGAGFQRLRYRVQGQCERFFESEAKLVAPANGSAARLVLVSRDISERKEMEAYVLHQSFHDSLTGLPNRLLLLDRLNQATTHRERLQVTVAVLFIDLDRFKEINDTLGHAAGDRVLQNVAERLSGCVRDGDTVARLGGDEFVVMLLDLNDVEAAAFVAEKIVDTLGAPCRIEGSELRVTASIGVAIFPHDATDVDTLLRHADVAMYHAKHDGGARFCFFALQMQEAARNKLMMGNALQRAIAGGEFRMHYQPKIDAASGAICGFEALMRWPQASGEPVSPAVFIPLAEETGRIEPIGDWAIAQCVDQLQRLGDAGFADIPIAVNVSALQFRRGNLPESLTDAIRAAGINPGLLEVELTESGAMSNPTRAVEMLRQIHELGVSIAIDDFGTGYSSLSYLKRLPIDKLKIDASFVRDIASDASDAAIVLAIITLAHVLHMTVIAEGVETATQVAFLREHGCDQMQGFFFSTAVPAEETEALLRGGPYSMTTGKQESAT